MQQVSHVVQNLGPALVVGAAGDLDRVVRALAVTDPAHPSSLPTGSLVVGIGHRADSCEDLLAEAARAGAHAVLVKGTEVPAADPRGPAVVVVDPAVDWGQLIALVRMSINVVPTLGHGEGDTLFAVAAAVAGLSGGSVVIHDAAWQLIAYAGGEDPDPVRTATLTGRRAPIEHVARLREHGVVDRMLKGEIVHLAEGEVAGLGERYAAAILVAGQSLGTIWVMPSGELDEEQAREGLRRGVEVAALALLRSSSFASSVAPDQDAELAALLNGVRAERLVAERLGLPSTSGFVLAGLRPTDDEAVTRAASARRLVGLVLSYCRAYRISALTAAVGDTAFVLLPCATDGDRDRVSRVLTDLQKRVATSVPNRAVLSAGSHELVATTSVREDLDRLLDMAERRGWSGLVDATSVQAAWLLSRFRELALSHPELLEGPAQRLLDYDREHGSGLVETLRAWFDAVGDVKEAGQRLQLHANTVRYRLRRAEEVAGLRLDDADERLLAEMQVRLLAE